MEVGNIVRYKYKKGYMSGFSGRIIEIKTINYPFGKDITVCKVQHPEGTSEWINQNYLKEKKGEDAKVAKDNVEDDGGQ